MTKQEIFMAFFENRKQKYHRWNSKEEVDEYIEEFFEYVNAGNKPLTLRELSYPPIKVTPLEGDQCPDMLLYLDADEDCDLEEGVKEPWDPSFLEEIEKHRLRLWFADEDAKWKIIGFCAYGHSERCNLEVICVPANIEDCLDDPDFGTEKWSETHRCRKLLYIASTMYRFLFEFSDRRAYIVEVIEHEECTLIIITEIIDGKKTRTIINNDEFGMVPATTGTKWEIIEYE